MATSIDNGEWYIPKSKSRLAGRLFFDDKEKTIILETFSDKYLSGESVIIKDPKRDKKYNSKNYNDSYQQNYKLINGNAHGDVTLYNCQWNGTEDIGKNLYLIKYKVQFVFWGIHLTSEDTFNIKSATLKYPYLGSWYDGWETHDKLRLLENNKSSFSDSTNNLKDTTPISINGGLDIFIYDSYSKRMETIGVHHSIKYQKLIKFEYKKPVPFKSLLKDLLNFGKLLEFSHGKPLKRKLLSVSIENRNTKTAKAKGNNFTHSMVGNYTLHDGEDIAMHSQHQRYMLLSRSRMEKQDLDELIKKWFFNINFYNIYDIYIDSNNWFQNSNAILSNVMFNNRFLNIVQGLESYYLKILKNSTSIEEEVIKNKEVFETNKKKILAKIKEPDLKKWCNSNLIFKYKTIRQPNLETVLSKIIYSFRDILNPIFGENELIKFFPRFASRVRNNLSHGLNNKTDQGDALRSFFQIGQILLAICILKTLDIKEIQHKIEHYDSFERYIYEINSTRLVIK